MQTTLGIGFATTRTEERILAAVGVLPEAPSIFQPHEAIRFGGILTSVPALFSQGLFTAKNIYKSWEKGYYSLTHILLTLAFLYLLRIKNPERLKNSPVGELGRLIGLDRVPEVKCLRKRIADIVSWKKATEWENSLSTTWITDHECIYFYIDGHVRVYHGKKARLPKKFVSRQKLCLAGTTEYWLNDEKGLPLMCAIGELNERLKQAIEEVILTLIEETCSLVSEETLKNNPLLPRFTLIFDREAYEPKFFQYLWEKYRVAVITYRKNVKDKWDEKDFHGINCQSNNKNVIMQLCEKKVTMDGYTFREIRKLNNSGHQTSVIATNWIIKTEDVAVRMFGRWLQENFFKYMIAEFSFDRIIEYGAEIVSKDIKIVNPEYSVLSQKIKKQREKKRRVEAELYELVSKTLDDPIDEIKQVTEKQYALQEKINLFGEEVDELLAKRKIIPSKIPLGDMPENVRYNKLKKESKLFINIIKIIAYRAETALTNMIAPYYKNAYKEGRMLIKELFQADADLLPDYENNTLSVIIHSLATPRSNTAIEDLCIILNDTETIFPDTNLKMILKTSSSNINHGFS
ncbi:MAG: hypothetical protein HY738_23530 [Bacteroidia bacterium]|nr:hypothetical protein [Bacteroidia bacterium]